MQKKKLLRDQMVWTYEAVVGGQEGRPVSQTEGVGAEVCPVQRGLVVTRQEGGEPQPHHLPGQRLHHNTLPGKYIHILHTHIIYYIVYR